MTRAARLPKCHLRVPVVVPNCTLVVVRSYYVMRSDEVMGQCPIAPERERESRPDVVESCSCTVPRSVSHAVTVLFSIIHVHTVCPCSVGTVFACTTGHRTSGVKLRTRSWLSIVQLHCCALRYRQMTTGSLSSGAGGGTVHSHLSGLWPERCTLWPGRSRAIVGCWRHGWRPVFGLEWSSSSPHGSVLSSRTLHSDGTVIHLYLWHRQSATSDVTLCDRPSTALRRAQLPKACSRCSTQDELT